MNSNNLKLYSKSMTFVIVVLFSTTIGYTQVKVDFKNPGKFYKSVTEIGLQKLLNTQQLTSYKPQPLPVSFADTLKKYYWIELCSYHITEKKYSTSFGDNLNGNSTQIDFREFDNEGRLIYYQISKTLKDTTVYTTTFDKATTSKIVTIKNVNKLNYLILEIYGEKENLPLISYSNGILIQDITMNGKIGEKANYRIAYMAINKP